VTQRFPREARLAGEGAFTSVFSYRCVVRSEHFSVFAKPNLSQSSRLGITVGKRVAARAVDRNYIKRTLREMFRLHAVEFYGMDIVVQLRRAYGRGSYISISKELMDAVAKLEKRCLTC
jgi:ribonuclease P protein component